MVFVQTLPATLVAPALRPLVVAQHGGHEPTMHALAALNMLGGLVAAPWLGRHADAFGIRRLLAGLLLIDAALLLAVAMPLPTSLVLGLRVLEGAAHVGGTTLLMAAAARLQRDGHGAALGLAGGGLIFAIAIGSALGGLALAWGPRGPFVLGAALLAASVLLVPALPPRPAGDAPATPDTARLRIPLLFAFVERYTVGLFVVTFALFARGVHGLSDTAIGFFYSAMTLPFALAMAPVGRRSDRLPRAQLLAAGAVLYASAFALLGFAPTALLAPVLGLAGLASALLYAPTLAYAAALSAPHARGRAMGLVNAAGCLGMLTGPPSAAVLMALFRDPAAPAHGPRLVFLAAASATLLALGAALPWLRARLTEERFSGRA